MLPAVVMDPWDPSGRQSIGLPSINHLDSDSVKQHVHDFPYKQQPVPTPRSASIHHYTSPPSHHPHTNHQPPPASAPPASLAGLLSPPQRPAMSSEQEKDSHPSTLGHSLPSIHEALGSEQPPSYPSTVPPPSALASAAPPPPHPIPTSLATSPVECRPHPLPSTLHARQGSSNPFSHSRTPYLAFSAPQAQVPPPPPPPPPHSQNEPMAHPPVSDSHPSYSTPQEKPKLPTLHPLNTSQSPSIQADRRNTPYSSYPTPSAHYEIPAPPSANSGPQHYPYAHYSHYSPQSAPSTHAPNPVYPQSTPRFSTPPRYQPPVWREAKSDLAHLEEKKIHRTSLAPYGDSVKRHLESFDLEASLNEMADGAGNIAEFSKVYRQRAHENQRIGMTPQSMPRLEEVDDMLKQSERIQMSLQRMRDVVFSHQQASLVETPQDPRYRSTTGYDPDSASNYGDDNKASNGFANGDGKTRKRGRAAPPGRCHSCNRAETPEWRRGPDGARTLCNACGLHYAKLTRKMGGKHAMTSSNLRPKSLDHASPPM